MMFGKVLKEKKEYKLIRIAYPVSNDISEEIHWLSTQYPEEDIFFEVENNMIKVYLKQLDFSHFKSNILSRISSLTDENRKKLLQELLQKELINLL